MCKVTSPYKNAGGIRGKTFTGYKAVIKVGNKLYSPVTGMEYKVGPVPEIRKRKKHARSVYLNVFDKKENCYEPLMKGKTGLFYSESLAVNHYGEHGSGTIVIKMTISGDLYHGCLMNINENSVADLVVGNHIDKIEFIKKNENENTT